MSEVGTVDFEDFEDSSTVIDPCCLWRTYELARYKGASKEIA